MFLRDNLPGFDGSGGGRMRASYVGSNTAVRSTHYSVADGALGFAIADGRGGRRHMSGKGSFLDGAKYFSFPWWGLGLGLGEMGLGGSKPWRMWELAIVGRRVDPWPAGCLFQRQPDAAGFGKRGKRVGRFQDVG